MKYYYHNLSYENLISCVLAGLVCVTASSYSIPIWGALIIGALAAPAYFIGIWVIRDKLQIDDPLGVIAIHGFVGFTGVICEGIFSDKTVTRGLLYGNPYHFGVQVMGAFAILFGNFLISWFLWKVVMERILFRRTSMRVTALDTYLV